VHRVIHFELNVSDPEGSQAFFSDVFGWKVSKWQGGQDYWLVTTGAEEDAGIDGAIMRSHDDAPRTVNTIEVASVDETAARVTAAGGEVVVPKQAIPGVGHIAYCTDPSGLTFGIYQADEQAQAG
jgi:predicted enzyme related to lactoylglutathione lyase